MAVVCCYTVYDHLSSGKVESASLQLHGSHCIGTATVTRHRRETRRRDFYSPDYFANKQVLHPSHLSKAYYNVYHPSSY
jgi:hypothetical protein